MMIAVSKDEKEGLSNPLTPKISLVVLLTVCQMILIMLVLRI